MKFVKSLFDEVLCGSEIEVPVQDYVVNLTEYSASTPSQFCLNMILTDQIRGSLRYKCAIQSTHTHTQQTQTQTQTHT